MQLEKVSTPETPIQPFLDDLLVVLVLYRQQLTATESFNTMTRSLEACGGRLDLYVYDNSPEPIFSKGDVHSGWRIQYCHDPANPGVSRAYNEGFKAAVQMGKRWLLLLDQDTMFPPDALSSYCSGVFENPGIQMFAPVLRSGGRIYSPCRYLAGAGFHLGQVQYGVQPFRGKALLNSGMLVSTSAFGHSDGFDERIGLDFADFAFNNRFRRHYKTFCLLHLECRHGFSDNDNNDAAKALSRFVSYCKGARRTVSGPGLALSLAFIVLVRSLVLSLRFRSLRFVAGYWQDFLRADERGADKPENGDMGSAAGAIFPSSQVKKISVCMATYNGERFIRRQLESILSQLAEDDELVISDDSSTDGTLDAISEYADSRIRLFTGQAFHSPVYNFEFALKQARGDILVLADQDDIWLPNKLEIVRESFSRDHASPYLIVLDAQVVDEYEMEICPSVLEKLQAGPGFWKNLYDNRYLGCCMAFSRELLERALPFPARIPMHDMWLGQLCERVGETAFIPVVTMKYRKHGESLTDFRIKFQPLLQIKRRLILAAALLARMLRAEGRGQNFEPRTPNPDPRSLNPDPRSPNPEPRTPNPDPHVSVIMPSYNQVQFLEEAVRSVLEQEGVAVELLVLDPGSTDGSRELLLHLGEEYGERLRLVFEPDGGQSDAINRGMAMSRGSMLGWLNSDDRLRPGALARSAALLLVDGPAWLYGRAGMIDGEGNGISGFIVHYKNWRGKRFSRWKLLTENFIPQMAVFWNRDIWERGGGLDCSKELDMDYDLWLKFASLAAPVVLNEYLADFRVHGASKGSMLAGRQLDDALATARSHARELGFAGILAIAVHLFLSLRTRIFYLFLKP